MHRANVERWTRRAQIGGAALLLGAGGLALMPGSWAAGEAGIDPIEPPKPPRFAERTRVPVADAFEIGSNWAAVSPEMPREDPPVKLAEGTGENGEPAVPPPPPPPPWRYLGSIVGPSWSMAIISVNDQQRLVRVGETIEGGASLAAIHADHVVVSENGKERRQDLAPRQVQPEGMPAPVASVPMSGAPTVPGMPNGMNPLNPGSRFGNLPGRNRPIKPGVATPVPPPNGAGLEGNPKPNDPNRRRSPEHPDPNHSPPPMPPDP